MENFAPDRTLQEPIPRSPRRTPVSNQRLAHGSCLGTGRRVARAGEAKGFRRGADSPEFRFASGFSGEPVHGGEIAFLQVGVLVQNLCLGHTRTEPAEDIPHRDPQTTDARFATTLSGLDRDSCRCRGHALLNQYNAAKSCLSAWHYWTARVAAPCAGLHLQRA